MKRIRVGLVGVGNCGSSLVQGLASYRNDPAGLLGVPFPELSGYSIGDIEIVCAFDIDRRKVGRDLSEAIFAAPNCTKVFFPDLPPSGVTVTRGRTLDGVSDLMKSSPGGFDPSPEPEPEKEDVVVALKEAGVQIVLNYLPVGSQDASEFYAECAIEAGAAFVNGIPVFLGSDPQWQERFARAGLPILGDDFKAQMGATVVQRHLAHLFDMRGAVLDRAYQLNVGGNTDFLNMLDTQRITSKRHSKTEAVQSAIQHRLEENDLRVGPSDYVPWLNDEKVAYMRMEGRLFGGVPMNIEVRLTVEDSPNAAAMACIAIRCARIALDRGLKGAVTDACAFLFKHPPKQMNDEDAVQKLADFAAAPV